MDVVELTQEAALLEEAMAYYHALLANSRQLTEESARLLIEGMPGRKLTFGGRQIGRASCRERV